MYIDRAIRILDAEVMKAQNEGAFEIANAIKLGLEALKVIREFRTGRYKTINSPLLGETEK
jgi:hypothetical protein